MITGSQKESTLKLYEQAGYYKKDKTAFIRGYKFNDFIHCAIM